MRGNRMGRVGDEAEIRLVVFVQRRRDADNDRVHRRELRIICGRRKPMRLGRLDFLRRYAVDVRPAFGERLYLASVNVEAGDAELLLAIKQRQWKADISQADDTYTGLTLLNPGRESIGHGICCE